MGEEKPLNVSAVPMRMAKGLQTGLNLCRRTHDHKFALETGRMAHVLRTCTRDQ